MLSHSQFMAKLDAEILAGGSSSEVARSLKVNEVTVRRRRAALRRDGFEITRRTEREAYDANSKP